MKPFSIPKSLVLGAATSAFQIEGGDRNHSWYRWSTQPGRITDGSNCAVACDHWNRVDGDTGLMKKTGLGTYRFGVEWSRIEPEEGRFDMKALDHYRDELKKLKKAGIVPLVTLHHFSNPLWMEDSGSWLDERSVERFVKFAGHTVSALGDLASDWITINEPNVYCLMSYLYGIFPPGDKSLRKFFKSARNMILAHVKAYETIHEVRRVMGFTDTMVGAAHHLRLFDPEKGSWPEWRIARFQDRFFHEIFLAGMSEGLLMSPLGKGHPLGRGDYQDFVGINYYSRDIISFSMLRPMDFTRVKSGAPVNDLGWEIYPEGLYRVCEKIFRRFGKPIFITENGTCDREDRYRAKFIYDHLWQVIRLIDDGVDVRRYYHWSFMDNFELEKGLSYRFGLYHVDFDTQKRTLKKSGEMYREICRTGKVGAGLIKKYCTADYPDRAPVKGGRS